MSDSATEGLTSMETTARVGNHSQLKMPAPVSRSIRQAAASLCQCGRLRGYWTGRISSTMASGVTGVEAACWRISGTFFCTALASICSTCSSVSFLRLFWLSFILLHLPAIGWLLFQLCF